jgi:hypothetical protein
MPPCPLVILLPVAQVDLAAEIRDTVRVMKPLMTNNSWIHMDLPAEVPPVFADGARLHQVLVQLLQNAIKHTTSGSITVHVSLQRTFAAAVQVQIADTGLGMSERRVQVLLVTPLPCATCWSPQIYFWLLVKSQLCIYSSCRMPSSTPPLAALPCTSRRISSQTVFADSVQVQIADTGLEMFEPAVQVLLVSATLFNLHS